MRPARAVALAALFCASASACARERNEAERKAAAAVARAIEVLRQAPNERKSSALTALRSLSCGPAEACKARELCLLAYALHVDGLALTQVARQRLEDGRSAEAAGVLGAAEHKLRDAAPHVTACIDEEGALRRKYEL